MLRTNIENIQNWKFAHQHVLREDEEKIAVILGLERDEKIKQATIDKLMEEGESGSVTIYDVFEINFVSSPRFMARNAGLDIGKLNSIYVNSLVVLNA